MKKILLMSVGGTISQEQDEHHTAKSSEGKSANNFSDFLNDLIKDWGLDIEIVAKPLLNKDSSNIIPDDWKVMVEAIVKYYEDFDAFLITHGTNTLGYTCSALSFALGRIGKPVVLTGSQISFGHPGSDAVLNLENAIRVIAEYKKEIAGVMAVFGSHIITGTRVKKKTEFEYDAFTTFSSKASLGRIGNLLKINRDALTAHMKFLEPHAQFSTDLDIHSDFEMNIASLTEFPGMNGDIFQWLVDDGVKGIIYRATGAGDPNIAEIGADYSDLRKGFEFLQQNEIPIVITTQAPDGIASMDVNEPGVLARKLGAIPSYDMSIEAMTTKLGWLLGRGFKYRDIRSMMVQSFRGEIQEIQRR
jgi:L-asparaginase